MLKQQFDYIAHGPKQGAARKLVILLHGYGVNARYMEKLAQEVIRSVSDALVLCVNAPHRMDLPPITSPPVSTAHVKYQILHK